MSQWHDVTALTEAAKRAKNEADQTVRDINGYVELLNGSQACLDGWFTSSQLRRIADAMDELSKRLGGGQL